MKTVNRYIVDRAELGHGGNPKPFTSLAEMNRYVNDEIRSGNAVRVKMESSKQEKK